ncbi:potassium transporter TrkA [Micromonospora echinofusca]|uniref:Potassium transporter TrkA n=1 Tax=Micromonospora echinofusca TaxID=47858 RepID=A0ABS3VTY9_MICEH|nr:potassium transporter TrkA [Micromonospora echinofusca]MBO4207859.1 potassium transporter TrkA [Micromonospora echinofusca]
MDIEHTPLPGIGSRHCFSTAEGRRVGVVTRHADGRRYLVHDDGRDPDSTCSVALTRAEAIVLAGLLGIVDLVDVTEGRNDRDAPPSCTHV